MDWVKSKIQSGKRYVVQGVHHQADDRICTFASKSNPEKPQAYAECVDNLMFNRYARKCEDILTDAKLSDEEKERKCMKYRWEYLVESLPMRNIPTRVPTPAPWVGKSDSEIIKYNPVTYKFDGAGVEDYEVTSSVLRSSSKRRRRSSRRGSSTKSSKRRGSCRGL